MPQAPVYKTYRREIILAILFVVTFIVGLFPPLIERFYSTGIYYPISNFLRICFGWIPFSLGDIFYFLLLVYILYQFFRVLKLWKRKQWTRQRWGLFFRKLARAIMIIYLVFQWEWGLNYHRLGSSYQLDLNPGHYTDAELMELCDTLNSRLTVVIPKMTAADSAEWGSFATLRQRCLKDYDRSAQYFPFMTYHHPAVKKMLIGAVGGHGGFSGYLNPFTGEAQLNDNIPDFLRPIVTCHEIGHQLGYAAEDEANMVGFLAARESANPAWRYSAYHDMMSYASRELYYNDTAAYNDYVMKLPPLVRAHSRQAAEYYSQYKSEVQTFINQWYDLYLKANSQEKGVKSYSYIVSWLIAYAKKYGWDKV